MSMRSCMSSYERVLICSYGLMWPDDPTCQVLAVGGDKINYSKLFTSKLIYAIRQTYQQYFALKISTISYSPNPLYLPFEKFF